MLDSVGYFNAASVKQQVITNCQLEKQFVEIVIGDFNATSEG